MDGGTDVWTSMDGWTDPWIDAWMDGWMRDGWVGEEMVGRV